MEFNIWIGIAALVIVVLTGVAVYTVLQVRAQERRQQDRDLTELHARLEGRRKIAQSILLLCRAFIARQVEAAEAAVRISGLLDQLQLDGESRAPFAPFDQLRHALAGIPQREAWTDLQPAERQHYQVQIDHSERQFEQSMDSSAREILENTPPVLSEGR